MQASINFKSSLQLKSAVNISSSNVNNSSRMRLSTLVIARRSKSPKCKASKQDSAPQEITFVNPPPCPTHTGPAVNNIVDFKHLELEQSVLSDYEKHLNRFNVMLQYGGDHLPTVAAAVVEIGKLVSVDGPSVETKALLSLAYKEAHAKLNLLCWEKLVSRETLPIKVSANLIKAGVRDAVSAAVPCPLWMNEHTLAATAASFRSHTIEAIDELVDLVCCFAILEAVVNKHFRSMDKHLVNLARRISECTDAQLTALTNCFALKQDIADGENAPHRPVYNFQKCKVMHLMAAIVLEMDNREAAGGMQSVDHLHGIRRAMKVVDSYEGSQVADDFLAQPAKYTTYTWFFGAFTADESMINFGKKREGPAVMIL